MLIQFRFKNFRSFRDDTILDLSATKSSEYGFHVIEAGGEKLLPVAAIYGANASGKSNLYAALEYMQYYVCESFNFGDERNSKSQNKYVKPTPFLFDNRTKDAESSFEVFFIDIEDAKEKTYNYGFCIDQNGVVEEWLNMKSKTARSFTPVFFRSRTEKADYSGLPGKSRGNLEVALEGEVLVVSLGAKLKIAKLKKIRDWFFMNEFADFGDPVESFFRSNTLPDKFAEDQGVQQNVIKFFATFDESIRGFDIQKLPLEKVGEDKAPRYSVKALHKTINSDELGQIPLEQESDGTLKMFALYPSLQDVLNTGSVLFVDELNARLHPLLVRNFILTLLNPEINKKHAQLVFTTHDAWQLSNNLLRRDEIWFTEKDEYGISRLFSLADFIDEKGSKIRNDENYEKNYLLGKYGAVPVLKSIDLLEIK
jgi:AAA15 family ATPase/GTPase